MVVTQSELNYIKSNWLNRMKTAVTHLRVGDDNTTPTANDTALGNFLTGGEATIETLDESVTDQLTWTAKYGITSFVGDTVREVATYDGVNIRSRDLTVVSPKSADQIFWVSVKTKITANNN